MKQDSENNVYQHESILHGSRLNIEQSSKLELMSYQAYFCSS